MDGLVQPLFPMLDGGWRDFIYPLVFCNAVNIILSFFLVPVLSYVDSQDGSLHIWPCLLVSAMFCSFVRNHLADICYYLVYLKNEDVDEFYNRIIQRYILTGQGSIFMQMAKEEVEQEERHEYEPPPPPESPTPSPPSDSTIKSSLPKKKGRSRNQKKIVTTVTIKKYTDSGLPRCRCFIDNSRQCPFQCKPGVKGKCRIHASSKHEN